MSHAEHLARHIDSLASGAYRWTGHDSIDALASAASASGRRRVVVVDSGPQKATLFDAFASAYDFPDHSGRNWDALYDLLCDYGGGSTLILDVRDLLEATPQTWSKIEAILTDVADWFNDPLSALRQAIDRTEGENDAAGSRTNVARTAEAADDESEESDGESGPFTALVIGAPDDHSLPATSAPN